MKKLLSALLFFAAFGSQAASPTVPVAGDIVTVTSCTVPCAVFGDASATTDSDMPDSGGNKNRAFRELEYKWQWGDVDEPFLNTPSGVIVGTTNKSRNISFGPLAAHVYNTAGVKTWVLEVCDPQLNCVTRTGTVTVTTWSDAVNGATICIANGATPVPGVGGCPADATAVLNTDTVSPVDDYKTFMTQVFGANGCGTGVTCMRALLRRGDSFVSASQWTWGDYSNRVIGAYGTGASPIINHGTQHANAVNVTGTALTKILDLHFKGDTTLSTGICIYGYNGPIQLHVQGVKCENTSGFSLGGGTRLINSFVFDSQFIYGRARNSFFGFASKTAMMGNSYGPNINPSSPSSGTSDSEHLVRIQGAQKVVVSNNYFVRPSDSKVALTIRGGTHVTGTSEDPDNDTLKVVVSENVFDSAPGCTSCTMLQFGPSGDSQCQWGYDAIFERNAFRNNSGTPIQIIGIFGWSRLDFRNNVYAGFNALGANGAIFNIGNGQYSPFEVTFTNGSATISYPGGLDGNMAQSPAIPMYFTTTGTLPVGLSPYPQYYYLKNQNITNNTFEVSLTYLGSSIVMGSSGSGTHMASNRCTTDAISPDNSNPAPAYVNVYNNTVYELATSATSALATVSGSGNGGAVQYQTGKNNLGYAPSVTTTYLPLASGDYSTGFDWNSAYNSTDASGTNQYKLVNPFGPNMPTSGDNLTDYRVFRPIASSGYPVTTGNFSNFPAQRDFMFCVSKSGNNHLGAFVPLDDASCDPQNFIFAPFK